MAQPPDAASSASTAPPQPSHTAGVERASHLWNVHIVLWQMLIGMIRLNPRFLV